MTTENKHRAGDTDRHDRDKPPAAPAVAKAAAKPAGETHGPRTPRIGGMSGLTDAAAVASGRHSAGGSQPAGAPQVGGSTPGAAVSGDSEQPTRPARHEDADPEGAARSRSF